jgi:hypothetical protein
LTPKGQNWGGSRRGQKVSAESSVSVPKKRGRPKKADISGPAPSNQRRLDGFVGDGRSQGASPIEPIEDGAAASYEEDRPALNEPDSDDEDFEYEDFDEAEVERALQESMAHAANQELETPPLAAVSVTGPPQNLVEPMDIDQNDLLEVPVVFGTSVKGKERAPISPDLRDFRVDCSVDLRQSGGEEAPLAIETIEEERPGPSGAAAVEQMAEEPSVPFIPNEGRPSTFVEPAEKEFVAPKKGLIDKVRPALIDTC